MKYASRLTWGIHISLGALLIALGIAGCTEEKKPEPLSEELYVLNERSNTLTIFTAPGLERHEADINMASPAPHHLHFDHSHIYYFVVSRTQGGLVHKYDGETNELLASSTIAHFYTGITTTPDAQHVLVTDFGEDIQQRTKMYKLREQDLSVVDSITCGSRPHYVAMSEDGNTVLIANAGSDEITLYYPNANPEDNVINVKIDPDADSAAQLGHPIFEPYSIGLSDDDSLAYVCCRKSKIADKATIFVFDVPRRMTIDTLYLPYVNRSGASSNYRLGLCELIDDQYLAVTSQDGNSLFLVDLGDGSYEEAVVQNHVAFGVTTTSDYRYLYMTASNSGTQVPGWVYEFRRDGGSLTVTDSVEVGMLPNGIHVKPGGHTHHN